MKTILVTGGSGFIGSHTCLALLGNGYEILVLDSNINSSPIAIRRVNELHNQIDKSAENKVSLIKGDIRDYKLLNDIFITSRLTNKPIQAVIHFAGLKSVEESINSPLSYWDVNVGGSINLFRSMEENNCRTIVFSSSATIYASIFNSKLTEDSEIRPVNPYGNTKMSVENILGDIYKHTSKNWRISNLRYFNPVGAHHSGELGEDPFGKPSNLFPYITQVASGRHEKLYIFGNDWPTSDGTGERDYIHVMDLAEAHCAALKYLFEQDRKLINLNIGTGKGTTVLELLTAFENVNGCKVPYSFSARRPGDVPRSVACNELAISTLKWNPTRNLEDICRDGWKWQINNPYGYADAPF